MPFADSDGIKTHYEVKGTGVPLLMLAPGGFDLSISRWRFSFLTGSRSFRSSLDTTGTAIDRGQTRITGVGMQQEQGDQRTALVTGQTLLLDGGLTVY